MKRLIVLLACGAVLSACSVTSHLRSPPTENTATSVAPVGDSSSSGVSWMSHLRSKPPENTAKYVEPAKAPASTVASDGTPRVDINGVPIEKVTFRAGVSSATVERMAKQHACTGGLGAGLITEPGPVEVYRMVCEDGKVFMARCELRQCKPM